MGRPTMRQNNDSWGYLRDELEWRIAAYIENTASATTAIQDALVTRLAELVSPHCGYRSERPGFRRGKSIRALPALVSCDPLSDPGGTFAAGETMGPGRIAGNRLSLIVHAALLLVGV